MALFFENGIGQGKTFLLYGNISERFFGWDLTERDFEQYLVRLLKSKGYEHIVFYGQAGVKGKYCLDPQSARFFFSDNVDIPMPSPVDTENLQTSPAQDPAAAPSGSSREAAATQRDSSSGAGALQSMMGRSRRRHRGSYRPGSLSAEPADAQDNTTQVETETAQGTGPVSSKIRYALRSQSEEEFFLELHNKMLDPDSKMAVILYDLFVMPVLQLATLRDDILSVWDGQKNNNLCLILAPQTVSNTAAMVQMIQAVGLGPKFLIADENNRYRLNPSTCFNIPNPGPDEIRNMLRRMMIMGIPGTGPIVFDKKLKIDYSELGDIVDEILYCSSVSAGNQNPGTENSGNTALRGSCSEIYDRLCRYLRKKGKGKEQKQVTLTRQEIAGIWGLERVDRERALQQLDRPGWEGAYKKISEVVRIKENNYQRQKKTETPAAEYSDSKEDRWVLDRMEIQEKADPNRMEIPHFILLGPPGVGKTTVARLIGNLLHEVGCLKKGHTVEVTREQLTSSYVAGIPKATRTQIDLAEEGVLFIDEAHALGNNDGGSERSSTGLEVIQTLNGAMTDPRRHFCVILAGYEKPMEDVYKLDQGFIGRFGGNTIVIKDYKPELLEKILRDHIKSLGGKLDNELTEEVEGKPSPLQNMLRRMYKERNIRTFENARAMINLAGTVCGKAGDRPICREDFVNDTIHIDWFEEADLDNSYEAIMKELNENFVGMDEIKQFFKALYLEIQEAIKGGEDPHKILLRPILIVGNPGTGKTTVAKCLARLYYSFQMLGTPEPDFVSASALIGSHVGESQERVLSHIHDAQDVRGMLVIDEAHEFLGSSYGEGAIGACMEPTTDREHPFMLVMNVYADKKKEFLDANGGIMSRFVTIELEDYKPEELFEICRRLIVRMKYTLEEKAADRLMDLCRQTYYNRKYDTGNGRWCDNTVKEIDKARRLRCHDEGIDMDSDQYRIIIAEDIPLPESVKEEEDRLPLFKDCKTRAEKLQYLKDIKERMEKERVGAEPVKRIIRDIIESLKYNVLYPAREQLIIPGHYFFKGNAGCGKTTGAEFLARYLHALGLIESAGIRKISATDLIGQYLGETGVKTRNQLMQARHHVTLVDEAYALGDSTSNTNSYKKDALAELVAFLDDRSYRRDTTFIFAGYNGDMDALYAGNQGLKSRIIEVEFPDFTFEECIEIFRSLAAASDYTIVPEAENILEVSILKLRSASDFANGRTIRTFYEEVVKTVKIRCIREEYEEDDERVGQILQEDIESVMAAE